MPITQPTQLQSFPYEPSAVKRRLAPLRAVLAALLCAMTLTAAAPAGAEASTRYEIYVTTCDVYLAGTDANVHIKLEGESGTSNWLLLDKAGNQFIRNMVDTFSFTINTVGKIKSVVIKRDDAGIAPGWCLDHLSVFYKHTDNISYAAKFQWYNWVPSGASGTRMYPLT